MKNESYVRPSSLIDEIWQDGTARERKLVQWINYVETGDGEVRSTKEDDRPFAALNTTEKIGYVVGGLLALAISALLVFIAGLLFVKVASATYQFVF